MYFGTESTMTPRCSAVITPKSSVLLEVWHFLRTVFISCLQAGLAIGWQGVTQAGPESLVQHIMTNFECKLFLKCRPSVILSSNKIRPVNYQIWYESIPPLMKPPHVYWSFHSLVVYYFSKKKIRKFLLFSCSIYLVALPWKPKVYKLKAESWKCVQDLPTGKRSLPFQNFRFFQKYSSGT